MTGYLLDTHVWFWALTDSPRLESRHREVLRANPEALWLSPVSTWELALLSSRGRLDLGPEPIGWIREALGRHPFREASLSHEIALRSREVDLPHADPADRFLAATALTYELTLLTVDERLRGATWLPTA